MRHLWVIEEKLASGKWRPLRDGYSILSHSTKRDASVCLNAFKIFLHEYRLVKYTPEQK